MADKKISELPELSSNNVSDGDWVVITDSSTNTSKKINFGDYKLTQFPTDTTNGLLLKVGDFGLGGAVNDPDHISYKTYLQGIARFFGHTTSSSPPADGPTPNSFVGFQAAANEGRMGAMFIKAQGALGPDGNQAWITGKDGSWADFSELYHNHNLVGTVSQSGGTPTGAVIERGSNANGDYVRFADGTQICRERLTFNGSPLTWNFPVGFAANPAVSFAPVSGSARSVSFLNESTSSIEFSVFESDGSLAGTTSVMLTAFGEWF